MDEVCTREKCTACYACVAICSYSAITMKEDECGFGYPFIDSSKCVDCGACRRVCPNNTRLTYNTVKNVFIAYASSREEQKTSASGGLASVLARHVIRQGGVVYGCSGQECHFVKHIRIDNEEGLEEIKGSKYVQSYIGLLFQSVKQDLSDGKRVLFVGTPCLVAGLKGFLRKEHANLLTVDLVCHGVPSQRILNSALASYPQTEGKCVVRFREKNKSGKVKYGLFVNTKEHHRIVYEKFPTNLYITGFLQGLYYRESCYTCLYARRERVADITLGDYWDKHNQYPKMKKVSRGLSMVLVNTEKGASLFDECRYLMETDKGDLENVVRENGQLSQPMRKHVNYDLFKELYAQKGFVEAARTSLQSDITRLRKHLLLNKVAGCVRCIPGMNKLRQLLKE